MLGGTGYLRSTILGNESEPQSKSSIRLVPDLRSPMTTASNTCSVRAYGGNTPSRLRNPNIYSDVLVEDAYSCFDFGTVTSCHPDLVTPGDRDGDSLSDEFEFENQAEGYNPALCDSDGDGLTDSEEYDAGTKPNNVDSDSDGLLDTELHNGMNPNLGDTDGDKRSDAYEWNNLHEGFHPNYVEPQKTHVELKARLREGAERATIAGLCGDGCPAETVEEVLGVIVVSSLPVAGTAADLRDVFINAYRLDGQGVFFSAIGIVPVVGDTAKGVKTVQKFVRANPEKAVELAQRTSKIDQLALGFRARLIKATLPEGFDFRFISDSFVVQLAKRGTRFKTLQYAMEKATWITNDGKVFKGVGWHRQAENYLIGVIMGKALPHKQTTFSKKRFQFLKEIGGRRPDYFDAVSREAMEIKTGQVNVTTALKQIEKDRLLLKEGEYATMVWHFFPSGKRGKLGTSAKDDDSAALGIPKEVADRLQKYGIPYHIHLPPLDG
jgi:hypothetical protein